ncbi:15827_t:CDS:1, partial [Entrophospora sp. SA101]
ESDVYSFGVIMTEMTTGKPPFCNTTHDEKLAEEICMGLRPEINKSITPPNYFQLAKRCLDADPTKRPTFDKLHDTLEFWHDALSERGLLPNEEKTKVIRESFEPFDKIQIESSYTPREGVFYIRRTLGLGQFSKPENYKDHYIY